MFGFFKKQPPKSALRKFQERAATIPEGTRVRLPRKEYEQIEHDLMYSNRIMIPTMDRQGLNLGNVEIVPTDEPTEVLS